MTLLSPSPDPGFMRGRKLHAKAESLRFPALLLLAVLVAARAAAQQPRITNGTLAPRAVAGSLQGTVRQVASATPDSAWVAYAAPVADGRSRMCCWSGDDGPEGLSRRVCRLEPGGGSVFINNNNNERGRRLEPPDVFFVFYRIENRRIERVRVFSEDCALDADGRTIQWLTNVEPAESVALLTSLATGDQDEDRIVKGAVSAIAQHGEAAAVTSLLHLARDAARAKVRSEALFWVAQRAGARAVPAITDAIERDPETDVKKRAVFALSQLPADEGVPKLIEVARTNRNPAVRRQAMFWLGQSKDPRALKFFEEILK